MKRSAYSNWLSGFFYLKMDKNSYAIPIIQVKSMFCEFILFNLFYNFNALSQSES